MAVLLYDELATAWVRGCRPEWDDDLLARAIAEGLPVHRFKRSGTLARVAKVLGILRGLEPTSILDIGSGRGAFLWPLLDGIRGVAVTSVERDALRLSDIQRVAAGGITRLAGIEGDVTALALPDASFDVVTILEVLEHLHRPDLAAKEVIRVARRFVIASVPSKPDDNPGHIQLFDADSLRALFPCCTVDIDYVPGHMIAVVKR